MGFDGIVAEGVEWKLSGESPNYVFHAPETARIKTLPRNIRLSDDLGFRFSDRSWADYPLTSEKFAKWLAESPGDLVNLFLGYESIGEHQKASTGIFKFWEALVHAVDEAGLQWVTPAEAVNLYQASREYSCGSLTSWTDGERDLSAWTENAMQREAIGRIYKLEPEVLAVNDPVLTEVWAKLQTSNHFHWMSTKGGIDGHTHTPLIPYPSPDEAHARFIHVLEELETRLRLAREKLQSPKSA